jgi:phosphinothricin acetyltransferase
MITLRIATPHDGAALAKIYEYFVDNTTITFEYAPPSEEEFSERIAHKLEKYPYIVAEENGIPIGYAYAAEFRERAAYNWDTELSVYVAPHKHRAGVGKRLYSALTEILREQNFVNLYAWITTPNP